MFLSLGLRFPRTARDVPVELVADVLLFLRVLAVLACGSSDSMSAGWPTSSGQG